MMTLEEMDARHEVRFAAMTKEIRRLSEAIVEAQKSANVAHLEAARLSEEGPTTRLRQNLVAGCYQIRLRAECEAAGRVDPRNGAGVDGVSVRLAPGGVYDSRARAEAAVADADAVLAALKETP